MQLNFFTQLRALGLAAALLGLAGCATESANYAQGDHGGSYYYAERRDSRGYDNDYEPYYYGGWSVYGSYGWPYCCTWGNPWFWSGYGYGVNHFSHAYPGVNFRSPDGGWGYRSYAPFRYEQFQDGRSSAGWRQRERRGEAQDHRGNAREQVERINDHNPPQPVMRESLRTESHERDRHSRDRD